MRSENKRGNNIIRLLTLIVFSLAVMSCGNEKTEAVYPEDLEGKRALLVEKKKELSTLQSTINKLNDEIQSMDPTLVEVAKSVSTINTINSQFVRYVDIQGTVVSDDVVNVVSEVPGRIIAKNFEEGDYVKKGQLVARLDLESITKQISEVETSLSLAKDVYDRQNRLWEQKIGSEIQFLQTKNNKERLEKTLETLNFQLSKAKIYAPISGTVDRDFLMNGEMASPGMPIVQILNTAKVKVEADLPERYLKIVKKGMKVDLGFPSIDQEMTGRISQLGRSIDPANRTLKLEIAPSKRSSLLKPNLLAQIKMLELTLDDVITVKAEYVLQEVDGSEFVFIAEMNAENELRAIKKYVETGETAEGSVVITTGLEPNELLVAKGSRTISEGELLEVIKETE